MKNTDKKSPLKELFVLEKMRKSVNAKAPKRDFKALLLTLIFLFYIGIYLLMLMEAGWNDTVLRLLLLTALFVIGYFSFRHSKNELDKEDSRIFVLRYKDFYLKKYINSLGFNYSKYGIINISDISFSNLFLPFQMYEGNDLITGSIDNVEFKFCDLTLKRRMGRTDDGEPYGVVIFQGLLFVANFNKKTKGRILVMSKNITSKSGYKKIKMDNSEFNDTFNVFTTDLQNAMYVLTPALMDRILELKKIMKCPISLSFLYDRIFIKIDKGYDSFEPDLNKSIVSTNITRHIKIELDAMFNIVKILKLNNRIWTIKN